MMRNYTDIFSYAISKAIENNIEQLDSKDNKEESDYFIIETLKRAKVVFDVLEISGLDIYGMNYKQFSEQVSNKGNIVFMSDKEYEEYQFFKYTGADKYRKMKKIIEIMDSNVVESNMNDTNICLKQDNGTELSFNTVQIEEDVLRVRCGLDQKEEVDRNGRNMYRR